MGGVGSISPVAYGLFDLSVVTIIFGWLSFFLRVYIRAFMLHSIGSDDWLMLGAVICLTFLCVNDILLSETGYGNPNISIHENEQATLFEFLHELGYYSAATLARISVCFMYLRITPIKAHRIFIYVLAIINAALAIATSFGSIFQCKPVSFAWTAISDPTGGTCNFSYLPNGLGPTQNYVSIISDVLLSAFPTLLLRDSKLNWRLKAVVIGLLSVGFVSAAASIARAVMMSRVGPTASYSVLINSAIWSTVEPLCCVLAGNIATYRPLFRNIMESVLRTGGGSSQKQSKPHTSTTFSRGAERPVALDSKSDVNLVLQDMGTYGLPPHESRQDHIVRHDSDPSNWS